MTWCPPSLAHAQDGRDVNAAVPMVPFVLPSPWTCSVQPRGAVTQLRAVLLLPLLPPTPRQQDQPCRSSTSSPEELVWLHFRWLRCVRGARLGSETFLLCRVALCGGGCSSKLAGKRDQVAPTALSTARSARFTANLMQHVNKLASANWH